MLASIFHLVATALSAVIIFACTTANAQQPKLEMHRAGVNADDGSGWHPAVSTKGAFSIRVPIPYNDFTVHDARTGEVSHAVGGKSSEGIKFMAVAVPVTAKTPHDLGAIPKSFSSNPANKVTDVTARRKTAPIRCPFPSLDRHRPRTSATSRSRTRSTHYRLNFPTRIARQWQR